MSSVYKKVVQRCKRSTFFFRRREINIKILPFSIRKITHIQACNGKPDGAINVNCINTAHASFVLVDNDANITF